MTMKPCVVCGEVTERSRCSEHILPDLRAKDRVTRQRTARWKRTSTRLRRQQPFCSECGTQDDLTVDHVIPLADGGDPYDENNLDVLCRPCNSRKGASTRGDEVREAEGPTAGKAESASHMRTALGAGGSR